MTGKPHIQEAAETAREEAPRGASAPAEGAAPAGDPEAPVGPVASVKSENVAAPQDVPGEHQRQGPAQHRGPGGHESPGGNEAGAGNEAPGGHQAAGGNQPAGGHQAAGGHQEHGGQGHQGHGHQQHQGHAEAAETDHERQLEHDLEELTAKAEKADEYLELAQRTRADFDNYRKRAARDAAAAQERGITKLAKELLPAVDNLDRALEAAQSVAGSRSDGAPGADNGTATLVSGIKLVYDDVIAALARAGIERYSPEGQPFDPQQHEAIAQQPVEGAQPGTVVEVYQRGYRLGDFVIRPARVVVAA
jgi:molecular chaperone GrpE